MNFKCCCWIVALLITSFNFDRNTTTHFWHVSHKAIIESRLTADWLPEWKDNRDWLCCSPALIEYKLRHQKKIVWWSTRNKIPLWSSCITSTCTLGTQWQIYPKEKYTLHYFFSFWKLFVWVLQSWRFILPFGKQSF